MDLTIIIVETNGNLKETTIKKMDENTLYKKCNLKKPDDFSKKTEWKVTIDSVKYFITLFAKDKGRANNENKYDFPPPVDNPIFFGNCILFAKDVKGDYVDLKIPLWIKIYEKLFGGFEDLGDSDSEVSEDSMDEHETTKQGYSKEDNFIVSDDEDCDIFDEDELIEEECSDTDDDE